MVGLDGLEINLVIMSKVYVEKFILILRGGDPEVNTNGKFLPHFAS